MRKFESRRYTTVDGLSLYVRDYHSASASSDLPTVLCLHGLTRNSADFEDLAYHLSANYRVLVPDQRGRGQSQWDPNPERYTPNTYVTDTLNMLEQLHIKRVIIIGTSLGGLMAMMMTAIARDLIAGIVLNDIGPEVDPRGLSRIQSYVGRTAAVQSWQDAAASVKALNIIAFPDYDLDDWKRMAKRLYVENTQGLPELAYDPAISKPINADASSAVPPDLWPLFKDLGDIPVLVLRGEHSDILSRKCFEEMKHLLPKIQSIEVPNRGHAPALDEGAALEAIDRFTELVSGRSNE